MENATKALLISAGILIAIVVIAIGILVIKNVSNTSENSNRIGQEISNATNKSSIEVLGGLKGIIISKEKFNIFLENFYSNKNSKEIMEKIGLRNKILNDQIKLYGWQYKENDYMSLVSSKGFPTESEFPELSRGEVNKKKIEWCKKNSNLLDAIKKPADTDARRQICKDLYYKYIDEDPELTRENTLSYEEYENKFTQSKRYNYMQPMRASFFWIYDDTGYISEVYYVAGLLWDKNYAKKN